MRDLTDEIVSKSVDSLQKQIAQLTKERDELKAEVLGFQVREIGIKGLTACAEKERDQLAAKCAEMRDILTDIEMCNEEYERVCPGCHEPIMDADENILETEHSPTCQFVHALSDQCGVGWLSPEKTKVLVEVLGRIEDFAKVANHPKAFDFETFQMMEANLAEVLKWAKQALEAVR